MVRYEHTWERNDRCKYLASIFMPLGELRYFSVSSLGGMRRGLMFMAAQKAPIKNIPWNAMRIVLTKFPTV